MLNCRACLWRCIRALDTATPQSQRLRHDALAAPFSGQQRSLRSLSTNIRKVEARPTNLSRVETLSRRKQEPWHQSSQGRQQNQRARAALKERPPSENYARKKETEHAMMWLGKRDPSMSDADWNARKRELQYLRDPLEVAAFVRKELDRGKATEMLQLVRMASHSMQVIVSWNHIIDYYMAKERMSEALKVYNEMKKRGQFPDSYTYTIVLRGLSINAHASGAISHALAVYHSMSAPNSRVTPSIIHTNAALRVCARALDMDALWGIAAKIPESGAGAANSVTYTTILNAIRNNLLVNAPLGELDEEKLARRDRGIVEGRRIWEDIVNRWRNADLTMEEELVCSMGRLLLIGSRPQDWDDVLSLVEQTMDIPRLVPRLGTSAREVAGVPNLRAPHTPAEYKIEPGNLEGSERGAEFLAIRGKTSNSMAFATPGNETLSMVQEACQKIVAIKAAGEYWRMLTDPGMYKITPDVNNLNQRLRILRQCRASGEAVEILKEEFLAKSQTIRPGTLRIAMSTCVRDKNNHRSLERASDILQLMSTTFPDADAKTVTMYSKLALDFPLAKGEDLVNALTHLYPIIKNLRLQLGVGGETKDPSGVGASYAKGQERQDVIFALRKIYAVYDRLLSSNMIEEEKKAPFKRERARLSAFLKRTNYKSKERLQQTGSAPEEQDEESSEAAGEPIEGAQPVDHHAARRGPGMWSRMKAKPEARRRPWFSTLGASDSS